MFLERVFPYIALIAMGIFIAQVAESVRVSTYTTFPVIAIDAIKHKRR